MVELPTGDFGFTIALQFFFSVFNYLQMEALAKSKHVDLAGIAAKAVKEAKYHVRHSADWMVKLGDGTAESRRRMQEAVDELWRFTGEMFLGDDVDKPVLDPATLERPWRAQVDEVLKRALLTIPETKYMQRGGREGKHTEHLGHMLTEMQIVARSFPDGQW
jgi:ring-1,2-phenylacetyl-CoA epoxidase subunit PaaC